MLESRVKQLEKKIRGGDKRMWQAVRELARVVENPENKNIEELAKEIFRTWKETGGMGIRE